MRPPGRSLYAQDALQDAANKLLHVGWVTGRRMRFVSYGNKIVLDFPRLCPATQSLSPLDTSPDEIRRAIVGRFVAILVFFFCPFYVVFICRLCVIFRGPPSVAFNFYFSSSSFLPFWFICCGTLNLRAFLKQNFSRYVTWTNEFEHHWPTFI